MNVSVTQGCLEGMVRWEGLSPLRWLSPQGHCFSFCLSVAWDFLLPPSGCLMPVFLALRGHPGLREESRTIVRLVFRGIPHLPSIPLSPQV